MAARPPQAASCKFISMVDYDTLVASLRMHGFAVERVMQVPENAGDSQFLVDGKLFTLAEVRLMLVAADEKEPDRPWRRAV